MNQAANNEPLFIEAFYDACENLKEQDPDLAIPDVRVINRLLAKHGAKFEISRRISFIVIRKLLASQFPKPLRRWTSKLRT